MPKDYQAETTTAITGSDDTALGLKSIAVRQKQPDKSRLTPLIDGVDAFYARATLAIAAERSLDLQYFLWRKDLTGQILLKLVLDAAEPRASTDACTTNLLRRTISTRSSAAGISATNTSTHKRTRTSTTWTCWPRGLSSIRFQMHSTPIGITKWPCPFMPSSTIPRQPVTWKMYKTV